MHIFKKITDLQSFLHTRAAAGVSIGFVPTMGALHAGHISLVNNSKTAGNLTVCSIFVNPAQFNNRDDFEKYPHTLEADIDQLVQAGCDVLFLPEETEIYPPAETAIPVYELGYLDTVWEGQYRPGHFQGVCRVVEKLFRIVEPQQAYFGLKDYQQCMVIRRLVEIMEWQEKLQLHFCPTLREPDGLAMSSRNLRLTAEDRLNAPLLYQVLQEVKRNLRPGPLINLQFMARTGLEMSGFVPDYIGLAHAHTLEPVMVWDGEIPLVCLAAAYLGPVRLIDNLVVT